MLAVYQEWIKIVWAFYYTWDSVFVFRKPFSDCHKFSESLVKCAFPISCSSKGGYCSALHKENKWRQSRRRASRVLFERGKKSCCENTGSQCITKTAVVPISSCYSIYNPTVLKWHEFLVLELYIETGIFSLTHIDSVVCCSDRRHSVLCCHLQGAEAQSRDEPLPQIILSALFPPHDTSTVINSKQYRLWKVAAGIDGITMKLWWV